jgi:hypothetical protein
MKDAVTILVPHISRQQSQALLNVGQDLRLKAGADFLQRINEAVTATVEREPATTSSCMAKRGRRVH